jgi:ADP-heptose:LPS heptosyltransferase
MTPGKPRVLVIRGGAIGDFILTLPAIRLIRESIPHGHLEVLGYPGIIDLALEAGLADAVRSLEHRTMAPLFARNAAIDEALAEYLRSFTLVVSYLYDPDGHFRASLERVGVKTLIECPHRVEPGKGHAAAQLARPLEALAMYLEPETLSRTIFQCRSAPHGAARLIAVHPGSGSTTKNWPLANWHELGRRIVAELPAARLALITGEAEAERGVTQELLREWSGLSFDHWDCLPLTQLSRRMADCTDFIGHDSGISHLAAACGLRCLLLFGPTDPEIWAPPQRQVRVLRAPEGQLAQLAVGAVLGALPE